jgi:hypothetical protein
MASPKFSLGQVVATPGALLALEQSANHRSPYLTATLLVIGERLMRKTSARTSSPSSTDSGCSLPTESEAKRTYGSSQKPIDR